MGVTPASTGPAQFKWAARPLRRKRSSPRVAPAEGRRPELGDAAQRVAGNGACATASLYTMQGKKGVNQDAMVVVKRITRRTERPWLPLLLLLLLLLRRHVFYGEVSSCSL